MADLAKMTIGDGAEALMRASGGRAKMTDLIADLIRAGKMKRGRARANYGTLGSTLARHPNRFVKVGPGEWSLTEARPATDTALPSDGAVITDFREFAAAGSPNGSGVGFQEARD